VPVLVLVQAARRLTPSTAVAAVTNAFFENQGKSGVTPGSSFLLVQGWSLSDRYARPPSRVIPAECVGRPINAAKSVQKFCGPRG
jgi:hypothetical protein